MKCEMSRCRNEATIHHIQIGMWICESCWIKMCKEQEWMEKEWDKALKFVGVKS